MGRGPVEPVRAPPVTFDSYTALIKDAMHGGSLENENDV